MFILRQTEQLLKYIDNCGAAVVSFDIFDTLIFRAVNRPVDIFEIMFEENTNLFPHTMTKDKWRQIRTKAEREARNLQYEKRRTREITIDEIYQNILVDIDRSKIKEIELVTEKKYCFINPIIYQCMKDLSAKFDVKIILASDMYWRTEQIRDLLTAIGFDLNLIDRIFISCDYLMSKATLGLYEEIIGTYNIDSDRFLHIGDNWKSDIINSRRLGMNCFYYDAISNCRNKWKFIELENIVLSESRTYLTSVRCLAAESNYKGIDKWWYEFGVFYAGPLFSWLMRHYIIDGCDRLEENDTKILEILTGETTTETSLKIQIVNCLKKNKEIGECFRALYDSGDYFISKNILIEGSLVFQKVFILSGMLERGTLIDISQISSMYKRVVDIPTFIKEKALFYQGPESIVDVYKKSINDQIMNCVCLMKDMFQNIPNGNVFIVGAGDYGKMLYGFLAAQKLSFTIEGFMDNNPYIEGLNFDNTHVETVTKKCENTYYVIATRSEETKKNLYNQLIDLGIQKNKILGGGSDGRIS